jgi:hypothetical protein
MKDLASFLFSSLGQIALRFRFKLVQTLPGAEAQLAALMVLCVALTRLYRHPAHRIFRRALHSSTSAMSFMPFIAVTTMTAVNHVRAATEAHHEIEERREK